MNSLVLLRQRGFTMVTALFLLVVMAALGAFIAVVSTGQQMGSAMDLQGARAYQAARAGIEWGTFQVWSLNATRDVGVCPANPTTFTFPAAATTLADFTVTVACTATADPGGFGGPTTYTITAVACNLPSGGQCPVAPGDPSNAGSANYIERRMTVTI
ncbi:MAG: agglutinin biogenesis protein MshP [Rhodocyclales bacterium]|nr:agglutinin biogenesis protein MshP [Rhodocyclales bacterium]